MKVSFSTLACPDWDLSEILKLASDTGYDGIELRFVQGEDSLWKLPVFQASRLAATKREIAGRGLLIACLDTSCRFHSADVQERERWLEEGNRMTDLAATLGAPGIRVFGDTIQPGSSRASTRSRIADCIRTLAQSSESKGVETWIETHGDFAAAAETKAILDEADVRNSGVLWDPGNGFIESGESPSEGAQVFGAAIRHVHLKDLRIKNDGHWEPLLTGEGTFPLLELRTALEKAKYDQFVSFEWEKKWHPTVPEATIAVPQFMEWFRKNW
jgi:sugar phosphate isomerase/epimerase